MPADEIAAWFIRFVFILVGSTFLVVMFMMVMPELPEMELRSQVMTARIAYGGGFWESPGVIDPERFTNETADSAMEYGEPLFDLGASATVTDLEGNTLKGPIWYNRGAVLKLSRFPSGITHDVRRLPVTYEQEPAVLLLEVWYAE